LLSNQPTIPPLLGDKMTRLSHAPLIEAMVELRWGQIEQKDKTLAFNFPQEDITFFPGQFHAVAAKNGFAVSEQVNPTPLPHLISYRFRKHANTWPCYQIGMGIFVTNQINNGYDWSTFKPDVLLGIQMLNDGHPLTLAKLPMTEITLRYQDAFKLDPDESPSDFLKNKLQIGFTPIEDFLKVPFICNNVQGQIIGFQVETTEPAGTLRFDINQATIEGHAGFVMNTAIRSKVTSASIDSFASWLESAHATQKHAFETLIHPTYLKSFK